MRVFLVLIAIGLLAYATYTGRGSVPTLPTPPTTPSSSITFTGRPGPSGGDICAALVAAHPDASCHVVSSDTP